MSDAPAVRPWQAPDMSPRPAKVDPPAEQEPQATLLTAERLEEIEAQAREEGFRRGLEEGRRDGLAARAREGARLKALVDSLIPQTKLLDDALLEQLGGLVSVVARQILRRELRSQPGEIVRVVREAVSVLPAAESRITLHLHPDDVELVKEVLHPDQFERPWRIVEDVTIGRGGARVETDVSSVDATVESRMNTVIARLLGDERSRERGDE